MFRLGVRTNSYDFCRHLCLFDLNVYVYVYTLMYPKFFLVAIYQVNVNASMFMCLLT